VTSAVEPNFALGGARIPEIYAEYLTTLIRNETPALTQADLDNAVARAISLTGFQQNEATLASAISAIIANNLPLKADLVNGLIPTAQIPPLALTTSVPVASQSAMLALTSSQVQPGDLALRSDGAGTFMLMTTDPTQLANWHLLPVPTYVPPVTNPLTQTASLNVGTDASGFVPINHTLGTVPSFVGITVTGSTTQPLAIKVSNRSATTVTFYCWNTMTGAPITTTLVRFDYYLVP
jgi:hypothetical protein